ncbi:hypothetical protein [Microbulbifer sp. DLAB2-AA]|uniref:hypothetical protein n=1 Tax=Microbulbifer sp. DLAB2-AA TaxID=3243394 RepID=UPI004039E8A4
MRWIACCIYGVFLTYPLVLNAESYVYRDIALEVPDGWSIRREYNDYVGIEFCQNDTGNVMGFFLRKGLLVNGGDPSAFLKMHPLEHPVSSVQIGKYSGYFVTFTSEGKCSANWFLGDGSDLLIASYQGDCHSVDFTPVIKLVESVESLEDVVD